MAHNEVLTLKKGLMALEIIKHRKGVTLRDVMEELSISKSTAFRILKTLEDMKYVYKLQTQYFISHNATQASGEQRIQMEWASLHSIYQTAQKLRFSTYIGKMDRTELVMTQVLHEPFYESSSEEIGNRSKLHQSALGKVILANLSEPALTDISHQLSLEQATKNTFQDAQLFHYHLKAIRKDGFAFDDEERIVGIRCVAVPVFRNQQVVAALAVAAPTYQISRNNIKHIVAKLKTAQRSIAKELEILSK
ncbi:IclR family transcriptional regulator [Paenibacillus shenyangensis]|uniref:IclR family transcriptional regulator n=1 Tax=Paenibacillus sp. A9 TaxID=1284352 RepID=UPI00036F1659|nr:IclR family transcriptional regulator C-terminal domain-containing protein [Paenibacillus sp. A9]